MATVEPVAVGGEGRGEVGWDGWGEASMEATRPDWACQRREVTYQHDVTETMHTSTHVHTRAPSLAVGRLTVARAKHIPMRIV